MTSNIKRVAPPTSDGSRARAPSHDRSTLASAQPLPKAVPGPLFRWVKLASWFELCLFATLLFFWIAPGYESQTALFGLLHGLGYLGLCALIFVAIMRRQAPWPLFAATLTPLGPVGSVVGIEVIERRGWGIEPGLTPRDQTGNNHRRREDAIT